jgi:hypothetical protein
MSEQTFADILNQPFMGYEPVKPLPTGTYHCVVEGVPEKKTSSNGNDYLRVNLRPLSAGEDVDKDALEGMGGLEGRLIFHDLYVMSEFGRARLSKFLADCGFDEGEGTKAQLVDACNGCQLLVNLRHRPSMDGKGIRTVVDDTAKIG